MPKVGNKSFPYTPKGIDDAMREKKRLGSGRARKREPMRGGEPTPKGGSANGRTLERRPLDPNRVKPRGMPRLPVDPNRVKPKPMPRFNAIPRPAKPNSKSTGPIKIPKPAKRQPVKTTPMKRKMK
jgi:hypothetical protein